MQLQALLNIQNDATMARKIEYKKWKQNEQHEAVYLPWNEDSVLSLKPLVNTALLPVWRLCCHRRTRKCIRDSAIITITAVLKQDNRVLTSWQKTFLD